MARRFRELLEAMPPERQAEVRRRSAELRAEIPLHRLREARELSRREVADALGISQANMSELEQRTDIYLGSLRRHVETMGGELEIAASFPDGRARIRLLEDLGTPAHDEAED